MSGRIVPVLAAVIQDSKGRILIARRNNEGARAGFWEFPGGKINPGEIPEAGLKREILEELQMEIEVVEIAGIVSHIYPDISILLLAYHCRKLSEPGQLIAHDEIVWQHLSELRSEQFSAADIKLIRILQNSNTQFQLSTQ